MRRALRKLGSWQGQMIFEDRADAGARLAQTLTSYADPRTVVYALPRGGVIVGAEVARILGVPLDLIVVRKIGHPYSPEFAIAAVSEDGRTVENSMDVRSVAGDWFAYEARVQIEEARRKRALYTHGRPPIPATDKIAIIVDDGLATGLTMLLAVDEIRVQHPLKIVVAVPVAAADSLAKLQTSADAVEVLHVPDVFGAVGAFYRDFHQVSDDEVIRVMKMSGSVETH